MVKKVGIEEDGEMHTENRALQSNGIIKTRWLLLNKMSSV